MSQTPPQSKSSVPPASPATPPATPAAAAVAPAPPPLGGLLGVSLSLLAPVTCGVLAVPSLWLCIRSIRRRQYVRECWFGAIVSGTWLLLFAALFSHFQFIARKIPMTCEIPLPVAEPTVQFARLTVAPVIPAYDRAIVFREADGSEVRRPLTFNDVTRTQGNVYWIPASASHGPHLRLVDPVGEFLVDLDRRMTRVVARAEGRVYAADLENNVTLPSFSRNSDGQLEVRLGPATVEELPWLLTEPGEYLGRITGNLVRVRFIPAAEAPEEPIHGARPPPEVPAPPPGSTPAAIPAEIPAAGQAPPIP